MSRRQSLRGPLIGGLLRLAWEQVRERIDDGVRGEGYSDLGGAHLALFRYDGPDGQRPSRLAETMGITKQSVNDLLRHLENTGYVELVPDPTDSRARLVRLTARGRQLHLVLWNHARQAEQALKDAIGKTPFEDFRQTLVDIRDKRLFHPRDAEGVERVSRRGEDKTRRASRASTNRR